MVRQNLHQIIRRVEARGNAPFPFHDFSIDAKANSDQRANDRLPPLDVDLRIVFQSDYDDQIVCRHQF